MSYFQENSKKLILKLKNNDTDAGVRKCQMGAYWATLAHYTSSDKPVLIVMPTGSGKTAVMMLIAFGLHANRILIITPSVVLRDQTADKFRLLNDLVKSGIYPDSAETPNVVSHKGRITSTDKWNELKEYDVVVATPHTISSKQNEEIVPPPDDLFDIVFFDEAHHTPAKTWDDLLKSFKKSKCVLLTATPFRQDNLQLLARIIYNYPVGNALNDGIYRPIEYHSIESSTGMDKDALLCEKAKELLIEERLHKNRTKILIRTDQVQKSNSLLTLYNDHGIEVKEVNNKKSEKENKAVLNDIREDRLDGIICVGMLGEGLDIPELKIAVLHDPPQSLPITLQFIGRLSRPVKGQIGDAHVIANPDDVKGQMRDLYMQDASWRDLIPKLAEEAVSRVEDYGKISLVDGEVNVNPSELAPFFSSRLYKVEQENLDLKKQLEFDKINTFYLPVTDENFLVLITESKNRPPWARSLTLSSRQYDLHIFYYHTPSKTLFECSTSDIIATEIRKQIIEGKQHRHEAKDLMKVLSGLTSMNYLMVGLSNIIGQGPSLPAYKTLIGKELQGAVRPSEGRVFTPGHALARFSKHDPGEIDKLETRGIGNFQGRVWSIKRASVIEFKEWCNEIGDCLIGKKVLGLPNMEFFGNPKRVRQFPDNPIAVLLDYRIFIHSMTLVRTTPGSGSTFSIVSFPEITIKKMNADKKIHSFTLNPNADDSPVELTYNIDKNQWTTPNEICDVRVDLNSERKTFGLPDFLLEYPPQIYLSNGGVVINGEIYQSKQILPALPEDCFIKDIDWNECDTIIEFADPANERVPQNGKLAIHDWLEKYLKTNFSDKSLILKDHAAGEIADFVLIEPEQKKISLYHCKSAKKYTPSAAISDLIVLEQVLRSINWIRKSDILSEIIKRGCDESYRPKSALVKGSKEKLENLATKFHANEWHYHVIMVQPGLDCKKAIKQKNTNTLLLNSYEWLNNQGAQFRIMGNS